MRKILLLTCVFISMQLFSQEQFNIGINGGITVGNVEPISKIAFGADVNYLFDISQDFVIGPSVGITYFNLEDSDLDIDAPMFLPLSAAFRFNSLDDAFYVGLDLGYAVALSDYDGGFYIKPIVGYKASDSFKINIFYEGIKTSSPTYGYMGLGLTYDLKASKNAQYKY